LLTDLTVEMTQVATQQKYRLVRKKSQKITDMHYKGVRADAFLVQNLPYKKKSQTSYNNSILTPILLIQISELVIKFKHSQNIF